MYSYQARKMLKYGCQSERSVDAPTLQNPLSESSNRCKPLGQLWGFWAGKRYGQFLSLVQANVGSSECLSGQGRCLLLLILSSA